MIGDVVIGASVVVILIHTVLGKTRPCPADRGARRLTS
jgi:hypothetical protein